MCWWCIWDGSATSDWSNCQPLGCCKHNSGGCRWSGKSRGWCFLDNPESECLRPRGARCLCSLGGTDWRCLLWETRGTLTRGLWSRGWYSSVLEFFHRRLGFCVTGAEVVFKFIIGDRDRRWRWRGWRSRCCQRGTRETRRTRGYSGLPRLLWTGRLYHHMRMITRMWILPRRSVVVIAGYLGRYYNK